MDEKPYNGKILNVNLSTGEISTEHLDDSFYRTYLGGYGMGSRLLFDRIPAGADALGPDNILGFFPGLLTGTPLFGSRFQVCAKSPKNNGWGDANCGGDFGPNLKFAGWDGILFYGKAEKPVYLYIEDDKVELRDASDIWGMMAIECEDQLKAEFGKKSSIALIGPAGEKLSRMAGVCNERGRLAARSGLGGVMGSKMLKAVVVKPSRQIIMGTNKELRQTLRSSLDGFVKPLADFFRTYGTTGITPMSAMNGDAPVKNWGGVGIADFQQGTLMTGDNVNARMEKRYACWSCPLACGGESKPSENPAYNYPHHTHRPEYETMTAFGTMALMNDVDALIMANHLCNEYGLDTIAAGATVTFAIECFENGILTKEDTGGLELHWSDAQAIIQLLHLIGRREGIGDVLGDGVKFAADRIGRGSEQFAMHIDGEEVPMHDPKLNPGYGTTYKLDPTPARHTQGTEGGGEAGGPRGVPLPEFKGDRTVYSGRGPLHKGVAAYQHVVNGSGFCMFVTSAAESGRIPEWINTATGWDTNWDELLKTGDRIGNLRMAFAVKHGNYPPQRHVPGRIIGVPPQEAGPHQGITVDLDTLSREFLEAAGWDQQTGRPSEATLRALGLDDVAQQLAAIPA
ncbi:MAG TPA: aldehyde ferredoxin oxidoreductase family protein [Dehalococcoidia bacterium]|nr:aldehyde ferredoxin oxidoreductase family protein [Dehalococcoidia bacterium]